MTIDQETLMAFADGELDPVTAKRVEKAIAADPALAAQVARHHELRTRLKAHFDPVAEAPVPDALAGMVRGSAKVVDLAAVREAKRPVPVRRWWQGAGAIAAALVVGVVLGVTTRSGGETDFATSGGRLVASGPVARALDTQLASTQPEGVPVKLLVSFRTPEGSYCRVFQAEAQGGIACRESGEWQVRQLRAAPPPQKGAYRQAGSDASALMADAQALMAGDPLDTEGERAAAAAGWQGK